jgi:hypothetical protein
MELYTKPVTCICQTCKCAHVCEYFAETIKPVIEVIGANLYEMSDPFIRKLDEALKSFTCDYQE